MSAIAEIDCLHPLYDIADMAERDPDSELWRALMAVRPRDLTPNAWAFKAGVNRNVFNDVRRRGRLRHDILVKLLDAIGIGWAEFDAGIAPQAKDPEHGGAMVSSPVQDFRGLDRPRDVPVLGTPRCGEIEIDGQPIETVDVNLDDVIDHVRRPIGLDGRPDVYGIYFTGYSMMPRFEPGELAYVDPRRPPGLGDYVVVQLRGGEDQDERIVSSLVKRLVRRSASHVELEQFNPPAIFPVPAARIAKIHRIMPLSELVAF